MKLLRVGGISLEMHPTYLLLVAFVAFEGWREDRWLGIEEFLWMLALTYTCVVLHEFGHALTARRLGIPVHRIILLPVGGMALLERLPRDPGDELLIVAAGPTVNFVIAGLSFIFLLGWPADWENPSLLPTSPHDVLVCLLIINLSLGTFNLLPAFPMDGGRLVRALLAYCTDYVSATWWALMLGRAVAIIALIIALWFQVYTLVILFSFIIILGGLEYRHVVRTESEAKFYTWMQEP